MSSKTVSRAAVVALALSNTAVNAFWRLECPGSIGLARIDPLMDFDGLSGHVHALKGGSAFSAKSTADDLLKSKCTSCGVKQDKSAYWAPPLYFEGDDGTLTVVPEKPPFKAYYELNAGKTSDGKEQTIEAFPNGFQMIAGDNLRRNTTLSGPDPDESGFKGPYTDKSNDEREQLAIGFNCMNYGLNGGQKKEEPTLYRHHLPEKSWIDANCPDGIRLELQFPSCWNGNMDGGESHKSHVAYPEWINGGDCPAGFDRRFPQLMYETIVATDQLVGKGGKYVLGNGDPTGYGYHGDFISAWDEGVLDRAVAECTDKSGEMKSCHVFEFTEDSSSCTIESMPDELKDEKTEGPMSSLPGGCEIQSGPERATKGKGASGSSSGGKSAGGSSPKNKSKDESPAVNKESSSAPVADAPADPVAESKPEGAVFAEKEDKHEEKAEEKAAAYVAPPAPTTTSAPVEAPVADNAGNAIRTDIYTSNGIVYENLVVVKEVTVTEGAKAKRTPEAEHVKRLGHRHEHVKRHGHGGRRLR
ncbi:MAG: hypothetical protein L6R42_004231 [Xanthoria sp. 1 TBL-2021]|nr:MAG: hypothetical protein L6R42_004231 [Xanthoria sp. 1 TBL-2021]